MERLNALINSMTTYLIYLRELQKSAARAHENVQLLLITEQINMVQSLANDLSVAILELENHIIIPM